jgi:hypothetical protein
VVQNVAGTIDISVIITARNEEAFDARALCSIARQA